MLQYVEMLLAAFVAIDRLLFVGLTVYLRLISWQTTLKFDNLIRHLAKYKIN